MTINEIKLALEEKGYITEVEYVTKNNCILTGLRLVNDNGISPVIYIDELLNEDFSEKAIDNIINTFENNMTTEKINTSALFSFLQDKEYIKSNIYVTLEQSSDYEKKYLSIPSQLEDIDMVFKINLSQDICDTLNLDKDAEGMYTIKLTSELLNSMNTDIEELIPYALENVSKDTYVVNMIQIMKEMMHLTDDDIYDDMLSVDSRMYVLTNTGKCFGASGILTNTLSDFAKGHNTETLIVLPSSVHECIVIIPDTDNEDLAEYARMVKEVNETQVQPIDQLSNYAYIYNVTSNSFETIK